MRRSEATTLTFKEIKALDPVGLAPPGARTVTMRSAGLVSAEC